MGDPLSAIIIAIDGPVGSGKSTVARRAADLLGYTYLDSGAMYRAVGWKALRDAVPLDSPVELETLARDTHRPGTREWRTAREDRW